jgi:hypothetical protein
LDWDNKDVKEWIEDIELFYKVQKDYWYNKIKEDITSGPFLLVVDKDYLIQKGINDFHSGTLIKEIIKLQGNISTYKKYSLFLNFKGKILS